jgi:hypothetical protein
LDQTVELVVQPTIIERQGMFVTRVSVRPRRENQGVIRNRSTSLGVRHPSRRINPPEAVHHERGPEVVNDRRQWVTLRGSVGERLADRHRAVHEIRLRGNQRKTDALAGEVAKSKSRLDGRNPATNNHHPERVSTRPGHARPLLATTGSASAATAPK